MSKNGNLHAAKSAKSDEFYTQFSDIAKEMEHYRKHFENKIVLCNCDNPSQSAFWEYFHRNFEKLGLKKLISTYYDKQAYKTEYTGGNDDNIETGTAVLLENNGDFRNPECIEILKQADIVVTNPPFSLFREYVAQLIAYDKKFIIIGNMNAITYKEFFPLIKDNKVWIGVSVHSGDREFRVPDSYPITASGWRIDESGNKYIRVKGVRWYTNLDYIQRHEPLQLSKKYISEEYPKYDNYDAINVDKTADIPVDYDGVIGVPISFLDKYCPEQFEIVKFRKGDDEKDLVFTKDGKKVQPYFRVLIRRKI